MKNISILLLFVTTISTVPASPLNNLIQAYSSTFDLTAYYSIKNYTNDQLIYIIPLIKYQNILNYTVIFTIDKISYNILNYKINFFISQTMTISSPYGYFIQVLGIRQIIISPYFVGIYYKFFNTSINIFISDIYAHSVTYNFSTNAVPTSIIKAFLTGYTSTTAASYYAFGLNIEGSAINSSSITILFSTTVTDYVYIDRVQFVVLVCQSIAIFYGGIQVNIKHNTNYYIDSGNLIYIFDANISPDLTFYGLYILFVQSTTSPFINYQLIVKPGNITMKSNLTLTPDFLIQYIIFTPTIISASNIIPLSCPYLYPYINYETNICYASCPVNMLQRYLPPTCIVCPMNCKQCTNSTDCTACNFGSVVNGSCTTIQGCIQVIYSGPTQLCVKCDPNQLLVLQTNGTCTCQKGFYLLNNLCTNVIGCLAVIRANDTNLCIGCNLARGFLYDNFYNCTCSKNLFYNQTEKKCVDVCGDGIKVYVKCDDGNLKNGDGCSDKCKIQMNWICLPSSNPDSLCIKRPRPFKLLFNRAMKVAQKNSGIFVFRTDSNVTLFKQFFQKIQFLCQKANKMTKWQIIENQLYIYVDYFQDLQSFSASAIFTLNSTFSQVPMISSLFIMNSLQQNLRFYDNYELVAMMKNKLIYILAIILIIFFISNLVNKMMGVQFLQIYISISLLSHLSNYKSPIFQVINSIIVINLNYSFTSFPYDINKQQSNNINNLYSTLILISIIPISILLHLAYSAVIHFIQKNQFKAQSRIFTFQYKIYNKLIFPNIIGFISVSTFYLPFYQSNYLYLIKILISISLKFLFIVILISQILKYQQNQQPFGLKYCNCYIPFFLLYNFALYYLFVLYYYQIMNPIFILIMLNLIIVIFQIWFVYKRPYNKTIDNLGQIINLLIISLFSLWILIRNTLSLFITESKQHLILFIFCFLLLFSLLIHIIRLIIKNKQNNQMQVPQKQKKQKQSVKKQNNYNLRDCQQIQSNNFNQNMQTGIVSYKIKQSQANQQKNKRKKLKQFLIFQN